MSARLDFWGHKIIRVRSERHKLYKARQKKRSPRLTARRPDKCFAACGKWVQKKCFTACETPAETVVEDYLFFINWLAFVMLS